MIPGWVGRYIGIPYEDCSCWELIRLVYREQFGLDLPPAPGGADQGKGHELWQQEVAQWIEIPLDEVQVGDILAFHHRRLGWHAGIVIVPGKPGEPGYMLHSEARLDSVWEAYTRPEWTNHLQGIYRNRQITDASCFRSRQATNRSGHRVSESV